MNTKRGLDQLKTCLVHYAPDRLPDFHTLEARFNKNENDELILGTSENTRNEHNQIMRALNALALARCGISFNDLCEGKQPPATLIPNSTDQQPDEILERLRRIEAKLDQGRVEDRQVAEQLLDALSQNQVAQTEAAQIVADLRDWMQAVQQSGLPLNTEVREALDTLTEHKGSDYQYLQLAIPLIPGILSYNVELGSQHQVDLPALWESIQRRFGKKSQAQPLPETLATWTYPVGAGVTSVAISAGGKLIIGGTLGKRVFCLNRKGQTCWSAPVGNQAWRVALSADGETAVVGTGSTRPWDIKGRGIYVFDKQGRLCWKADLGASVWGLSISTDGCTIAVGTDGHEVLIYDRDGHLLWRRRIAGIGWYAWVWATALSANGETIVLGAADKTVQILDRGGNLLGTHKAAADVFTVAVSADGQTIAAGSSDQQVYLLDRHGNLQWYTKLEDKVWAVALTGNGARLIVGAGEKEAHVRVFDRSGQSLWRRYVVGGVTGVSLAENGRVIGVGTRDGHFYLFDDEGNPLCNVAAAKTVRDVAISANGRVAVAGSEDGYIYGVLVPSVSRTFDSKGNSKFIPPQTIYHGIGKAWAVLVGINHYGDTFIPSLKVCVDDVTAIHQSLAGKYEVAKLLTDAAPEHLPTRANILGELSTIAQSASENDLLLFYFSGHGMARDGESYLLARDTRLSALKHTAVAMKDIREIVAQSPAHAKVIVLDACHSGASIGKAESTMMPEFIQRVFGQAEGMAVLASCKENQQSWEWPEKQRSVFTYYLLEALTGKADFERKGFVSVTDVSNYVTHGVKTWAAQRSVPQTPTLQYTAAGDIILLRHEDKGL
ncbi:MAG: caspase family protein [Anaerolineae bacterium]|nr:caspase family protein [Anaerolineae bacterium]